MNKAGAYLTKRALLNNDPSLFIGGELNTLLEHTNEDMREDQTLDGFGFVGQGETVLHTALRVCANEGSKTVDQQLSKLSFSLLNAKLTEDVRPLSPDDYGKVCFTLENDDFSEMPSSLGWNLTVSSQESN